MIFYSRSPDPHVAQILGGKLRAEIRNVVVANATHLALTWAYPKIGVKRSNQAQTPCMSKPLLHTPPSDGTFNRKCTPVCSALTTSLRLSALHVVASSAQKLDALMPEHF